MRDINRIDKVLKVLGDNWKKLPDWRLSQLICNMQRAAGNDLFYVEDDEFADMVEEYVSIITEEEEQNNERSNNQSRA